MNLEFHEKLVIVGGGRGEIGKDICDFLRLEGANVVSVDIEGDGGVDLADPAQVSRFFKELRRQYRDHPLHGYCSAVHAGAGKAFDLLDEEFLTKGLKGTLLAAVYPVLEAIKWMKETGGGHVVLVSSINSVLGLDEPAYDMAKAALNQFARDIATSQGQYSIYAVALCPGSVLDTPAWRQGDPRIKELKESIPDQRVTTKAEVAAAVGFLLSKHAQMFRNYLKRMSLR